MYFNKQYRISDVKDGLLMKLSTHLEKPSPFYLGYKIDHNKLIETLEQYQPYDRIFIITEQVVFDLYGAPLLNAFQAQGIPTKVIQIPNGEKSKNFPVLEEIGEALIQDGASKRSILIAFGGGAAGNLAGMLSGLIYRGIRYVEMPTSFTGQTDSTLSNKQAINGKYGKNHFGFYHAPIFIWADTQYLKTEPAVTKRAGIVEAIKNGFISNPQFLNHLSGNLNPDLNFSEQEIFRLVFDIIHSKLDILKRDPTEKHYAIVLEYGHTFGHAIEWMEKGKIIHGEAVAIGMKIAARLSHMMGLITMDTVRLHYDLLENKLGLRNVLPKYVTPQGLMEAMTVDNKKTGKDLRFIVLDKIGSCYNPEGDYLVTIEQPIVRKIVESFIENPACP